MTAAAKQSSTNSSSSTLEKVLEHRFIADLTTKFWVSGYGDFEILRSEVDSHGYDLVIEAYNTTRHVQLKALKMGGKRSNVTVNLRLARKSSGCIVWFVYDPETLTLGPFYWFGGPPGEKLPETGNRKAKHSKANAQGIKNERPGHRVVTKTSFKRVDTLDELISMMFSVK